MDVEIENYIRTLNLAETCRTCLSECNQMTSIFTELENTDEDYISYVYQVLMNVASIQVSVDDGLPTLICKKCVENANNAFKFKILCERSQALLETYLLNTSKDAIPSENDEEKTISEKSIELDSNYIVDGEEEISMENSIELEPNCIVDGEFQETDVVVETLEEKVESESIGSNLIDSSVDEFGSVEENIKADEADFLEQSDSDEVKIKYFDCEALIIDADMPSSSLPDVSNQKIENKTKRNSHKISRKKRRKNMNFLTRITEEGEKRYICSICNKEYKHSTSLTDHIRVHTLERPFICKLCPKTFRQSTSLTYHMRSHTGESPYKCSVCEKRYRQSTSLTIHMRVHTGQRPFLCSVCGKSFRQAPDLRYHMRTHTNEKPYMCNICGKRMSMQSHLVQHMRTHTGEKPFPCKQCGKAFPTSTRLKRHEIIHTDLKPFECQVCNKCFNRDSTLKAHALTHDEKKPHRCSLCKKDFIQMHSLKTHLKTHDFEDMFLNCDGNVCDML